MNKKIVIYEPPMCCSSGMCGPNVDPKLINLNTSIIELKKMGIEVERFIITQSPEKFKENDEVINLLNKLELKALPITVFNGKIVKYGEYPTLEEFNKYAN